MRKYTFYTNKKIVGLFLASKLVCILQLLITLIFNITIYSLSELSLGSIVFALIFIYKTVVVLKVDEESISKGFIFKKVLYWRNIYSLRVKDNYLTIFTDEKNIIVDLNILRGNVKKYKSFFKHLKENISNNVKLDTASKYLLDGGEVKTSVDVPQHSIGGWLLLLLLRVCWPFMECILFVYNLALFNGVSGILSIATILNTIIICTISIITLIYFFQRRKNAIKWIKAYEWTNVIMVVGLTVISLIGKGVNFKFIIISSIGITVELVLVALLIVEYLNTSTRVKNTLVEYPLTNKEIRARNSGTYVKDKKRVTILFFGKVDSDNATNWYNEIKQQLQVDNIKIDKIIASPDKLLDGYSKYYDLDSREKLYLESINNKTSDVELCELGFSCGDNNTSTPCYGDMSWGKQIYKEGMSLSFNYSAAQNVTIEKYIDIYKKYIDWHWIHMYEIDHVYEVSVKRVKGHMVEHSRSKKVLNDWKK